MISQPALEALLPWWQKELKLQDWTVVLLFKRSWDTSLDGALGRCQYEINRKTATLILSTPEDCQDQDEDLEETLVHELLHLHTATFDNSHIGNLNKTRRVGMEQMVDIVAIALVRLRRDQEKARLEGLKEGLELNGSLITAANAEIERLNRRKRKKASRS